MSKVIVVGGGAAGMMAAVFAARKGQSVTVYEKNEKLGKKLFITGKGRCNLTNACDVDELFRNVLRNPKFLYSGFYGFDNHAVMEFFEKAGCALKVERGGRVFPVSDHSSSVLAALQWELKKSGVEVRLRQNVQEILVENHKAVGVRLQNEQKEYSDSVILATGGLSYPLTGSTGEGYTMAVKNGHTLLPLSPSLVPFEIKESFCSMLQGLSLKNVEASIWDGNKELYRDFGEMLFTHYGVSGPLILSGSGYVSGRKNKEKELILRMDLKPALSEEQLDKRILRDFEENKNKQFKNAVNGLFPLRLIPVMIEESGIHPDKPVFEISREERKRFVRLIKHWDMTITGQRDYKEAIITRGGLSTKEINPSTMESKLVKNLFFAGEIIDLDALTGGFNLQIAWSTGYLAGSAVCL